MTFSLSQKEIEQICRILKQFPQIEEGLIFGSRAMGNQKRGSDIDLAIKGKTDLSLAAKVKSRLEEDLPLPYFFDVIDYHSIGNPQLKEHIDRFGKVIYKRG